METIFESKKLELIYEGVGEAKARKQNFSNIKENATHEDLAGFATLMGQLAPEQEAINSVFVLEKQQINLN